jgi:hypothetical protein
MIGEERFAALADILRAVLGPGDVCVEFEHARAFGTVHGCFRMRKSRTNWGAYLRVGPVPEDFEWPDPRRTAWQYKDSHPSVKRFRQREHLRRNLKDRGALVTRAMRQTKRSFVDNLTLGERDDAMLHCGLTPAQLWQSVRGTREYLGPESPLFGSEEAGFSARADSSGFSVDDP